MRNDSIQLEEIRLQEVRKIQDYPDFHERHRVIPAIFENRNHRLILDVAAGVGCAAQRIHEYYPAELLCNDITPKCLDILSQLGLKTISFDLDNEESPYPFTDGHFDAVLSLATIEHLLHVDHFLAEAYRILSDGGYLYISSPNYASLDFVSKYLFTGKAFHDPLSKSSRTRYEFFAHVRYFTYRTLLEYVSSFGFVPDTLYLALPGGSSRYQKMLKKSKFKAYVFRNAVRLMYTVLPPRWASEPILCFRKQVGEKNRSIRKVIL